jgi:hypothetical protein
MKKLGLGAVLVWSVGGLLGCPPIVVDPGGTGDGDDDPCATVRCSEGTHCEVNEVQCIAAPCPPLVECVSDEDPPPPIGCEAVLCAEGTICIDSKDGPACVPAQENPCNLVDCRSGHTCVVEEGEPSCVPVEADECGGQCREDQHCELVVPPCAPPVDHAAKIAAPACEPVPTCVDNPVGCDTVRCGEGSYCDDISGKPECLPLPSCELVDCRDGYVCQLVDVVCVRAPCPPQPECVPVDDPSDDPCAAVRCRDGLICQVVDGAAQCVGKDPCALVDCVEGTHCELVDVVCITAPCNPVAECVPDAVCGTD